jgi:hypothetical protein
LAIVLQWRQVGLWVVWLGVLLALSISPTLFTWVMHIVPGLRFSQWAPIWSGVLPIGMIVAYGCHALLTSTQRHHITTTVIACTVGFVGIGGMALRVAQHTQSDFHWSVVVIFLVIVISYIVITWRMIPNVVLGLVIITMAYSTYPLLLHQPRTALVTQSDLVSTVRDTLLPGQRYAVVSAELADMLAPNFNTMQQLASVHSYHNFTSFYYQNYLRQMGGKSVTFGRLNRTIAPDYASMSFWMSNIGAVLSYAPIDDPHVVFVKKTGAAMVYRVTNQMGLFWRIPVQLRPDISDIRIDDYRNRNNEPLAYAEYHGDTQLVHYPVMNTPTLMVLSQQYDELWRAEVYDGTVWQPTRIVSVNGVFMGVYLPSQSTTIRLTYHTYMQYMWLSHLLWMIGLLTIAYWYGRIWWQTAQVHRVAVDSPIG